MSSTSDVQTAAIRAVREFLAHTFDIATLELEIADLWVANNRELDGTLGEIYNIVTDWDHKYTRREVVERLTALVAATPN
jgi:hypothetical protein